MIISVQFYKFIDFSIVKISLRKIVKNMFHENVFATLIIKKIAKRSLQRIIIEASEVCN